MSAKVVTLMFVKTVVAIRIRKSRPRVATITLERALSHGRFCQGPRTSRSLQTGRCRPDSDPLDSGSGPFPSSARQLQQTPIHRN